jgi:hypothetical protein
MRTRRRVRGRSSRWRKEGSAITDGNGLVHRHSAYTVMNELLYKLLYHISGPCGVMREVHVHLVGCSVDIERSINWSMELESAVNKLISSGEKNSQKVQPQNRILKSNHRSLKNRPRTRSHSTQISRYKILRQSHYHHSPTYDLRNLPAASRLDDQ